MLYSSSNMDVSNMDVFTPRSFVSRAPSSSRGSLGVARRASPVERARIGSRATCTSPHSSARSMTSPPSTSSPRCATNRDARERFISILLVSPPTVTTRLLSTDAAYARRRERDARTTSRLRSVPRRARRERSKTRRGISRGSRARRGRAARRRGRARRRDASRGRRASTRCETLERRTW